MDKNFKTHIITLLLKDDRLKDEQGELKGNLVKEFANTLDENLITTLLEDEKTRAQFFLKIKEVYVFKTNKFKFFLDENSIDNSYTQYSNQIGLSAGGKFLKDNTDVVLNFPFKDCVLEGGQSTEDGLDTYFEYDDTQEDYIEKQSKRKEIFFNEVLAKDEIDRLLEPKAFTNITKYDSKGESKPTQFNRNAKGTITDNLIIKGNNLLALYSLKQEFKGKVKLIYIDPPYNTGNDSFAYNDNFNHSTWLTFMRNRLMVAKDLLREDGVIFISCDDNEMSHLRILMDEIKEINYESIFHIKVRHENRILRQDNRYQKVMEHLVCFSKNNYNPNRIFNSKDKNKDYQFNVVLKENETPQNITINNYDIEIYKREQYEIIKEENGQFKEYNIRGSLITQNGSASQFYELYLKERKGYDGLGALYKVINMGEKGDGLGYRFIRQPFDIKGENGFYYQGKPIKIAVDKGNPYPNYYDFEKEFNNSSKEGGITFKNGKKPEMFISKILEISKLEEKDIILDFHLGSGSTAGTCHKSNYQYIGVEQMDSQIELSIIRLKNAIQNEQTTLSKSVNWKGGGSFVYLELAKNNQTAKEEILKCKNLEELLQFFETMYTKYFLHYNVRIKQFKEVISQEENFKNLALDRQKEIFSKMLDLNQLYVNLSEIEDSRYKLNAKDIALSKDFYQVKK
jgi:adenine-specific DNA-methyltransferase